MTDAQRVREFALMSTPASPIQRTRPADALDSLRQSLARHVAGGDAEARSLAVVSSYLAWLPEPFDESADPTHVTGSAIVRDGDGRILLHRHKRLGVWLQPGGHLERGEAPWDAAQRETHEETGVVAVHPEGIPALIHVDVHEGPRGHVHLDLRYLLEADGGAPLAPGPGESPDVAWFVPGAAATRADGSLAAALASASLRTGGGAVPPRHGDG